jgi:dTDP-glucose 4,6-dehydratase
MNKKKVLITGSCGFVFGNFIRKAIYEKHPYSFVSIDRVNANAINSMYWNKNHTFHVADVRDQHIIDIIFQFEKPDIVIHGAAEDESANSSYLTSNILGTQVITNACVKYNVEKLIYISTDEVYGQLTSEQDPSWTEESPINPRNSYAVTKAASELIVKAANQSHGLMYNIIRSSNNYGPRQTTDKLIPKAIKNILQGTQIPVYGKGLHMRDWTHVFDNCAGILTVLNDGLPNEIYNISSNQEFTNIEVIQKVCNAMEKGYNLISYTDDPRKNVNNTDFRYSINSNKLKSLGWKPNIKLSDGLNNSCIPWYLNNQWWFK